MLSKRPEIVVRKSSIDNLLEGLTLVCVLASWLIVVVSYQNLPDIVPVHFDLKGNVDGYGGKETILILPLIVTAVVTGIYFLNKFPHYFNYMVEITEKNAEAQYRVATRLLRFIQLIIALIFLAIISDVIKTTKSGSSMLGAWFVPVMILLLLAPVVWTMIRLKFFATDKKK